MQDRAILPVRFVFEQGGLAMCRTSSVSYLEILSNAKQRALERAHADHASGRGIDPSEEPSAVDRAAREFVRKQQQQENDPHPQLVAVGR